MTREEAIFYIKELQKTYASMDKKVAEAVDMAIEALSAEGDLISRAEVHKILSLFSTEGGNDAKMLFMDAHESIDNIPSARPTGEWVPHILAKGQKSIDNDVCSECGERYADAWEFNFCPNCGAKMKGGEDE